MRDDIGLLALFEASTTARSSRHPDLYESLAAVDRFQADFVSEIDARVAKTGMAVPKQTLRALLDGFDQLVLTELDLGAAVIPNVIWATGTNSISPSSAPILDGDGYPIQKRGVTDYPADSWLASRGCTTRSQG